MWLMDSLVERARTVAAQGKIDDQAPVRAQASIDVAAPAPLVWQVLADVEQWPRILSTVTRASWLDASVPMAERRFQWRNGGVTIRSQVAVASPGQELSWTGTALWLVAVHRNTITPLDEQNCRLSSSESMAGLGASLLMPTAKLAADLETFVTAIAAETQRRG